MKHILQVAMLFAMLMVSVGTPAYAQLSEVSVTSLQSVEIDRHGICKVVKNLNPTNALYVPSMSRDEWVNFISAPPWREVSECVACAGYLRDGYCFYAGAEYQACNDVCSAHGGLNASGMNRLIDRTPMAMAIESAPELHGGELLLAGGGATSTYYCAKVAEVLVGVPSTNTPTLQSSGRYGCVVGYYGSSPSVYIDSAWDGASIYNLNRARPICSCNR